MANGNALPQQNRSNSAENRENGDHRGHSFPPVGYSQSDFVLIFHTESNANGPSTDECESVPNGDATTSQ